MPVDAIMNGRRCSGLENELTVDCGLCSSATGWAEAPPAEEVLEQIRAIVADSDVSSFEILHSGLVRALLRYLTLDAANEKVKSILTKKYLP